MGLLAKSLSKSGGAGREISSHDRRGDGNPVYHGAAEPSTLQHLCGKIDRKRAIRVAFDEARGMIVVEERPQQRDYVMRFAPIALAAALLLAPAAVMAQAAAAAESANPATLPGAAQAAKFKTSETPVGDILDNPAAAAVVKRHLPDLVGNEQINMARGMTLKALQQYSADTVTDQKLSDIDAEFAKLGGK
jgi:hypothetical protein